jgi:hypothetical protein
VAPENGCILPQVSPPLEEVSFFPSQYCLPGEYILYLEAITAFLEPSVTAMTMPIPFFRGLSAVAVAAMLALAAVVP